MNKRPLAFSRSLIWVSLGSGSFDEVCNKTLRARAEAVRIFLAMLEGRHDETVPKDPLFASARATPPSSSASGKILAGASRI